MCGTGACCARGGEQQLLWAGQASAVWTGCRRHAEHAVRWRPCRTEALTPPLFQLLTALHVTAKSLGGSAHLGWGVKGEWSWCGSVHALCGAMAENKMAPELK